MSRCSARPQVLVLVGIFVAVVAGVLVAPRAFCIPVIIVGSFLAMYALSVRQWNAATEAAAAAEAAREEVADRRRRGRRHRGEEDKGTSSGETASLAQFRAKYDTSESGFLPTKCVSRLPER